MLQSFNNNGIVNNTVTVVKIPGNKSLPKRTVNQTLDGEVHLPDKFVPLEPSEITDETGKEKLSKAWLYLLPFILTNSDKYPKEQFVGCDDGFA